MKVVVTIDIEVDPKKWNEWFYADSNRISGDTPSEIRESIKWSAVSAVESEFHNVEGMSINLRKAK